MGRVRGLGRAGVPRLLRRRRAAHRSAARRGFARARRRVAHAHGIPAAQDHLAFLPARLLAILANVVGTLAVVVVAVRSIRRRPLGNSLIVLGVAAAATGSGLAGLGAAGTALGIAVGAMLLYAGFVLPALPRALSRPTAPEPSR